ncbi:unnamed protein product, partial [Effrenium voratum]
MSSLPVYPLPRCHFRSWASDWRGLRLGCGTSQIPWGRLKRRMHRCLKQNSQRQLRPGCSPASFVGPLRQALAFPERRALQQLCSALQQPDLCPPRRSLRPLDWSECWLGVVSALVAAFVAALGETTGAVRRFLLAAARTYLAETKATSLQVPTLQVLLSGWPIYPLLAQLNAHRGGTAWATALQLRAHRLAQRLPCAGHGEELRQCLCRALRPVAVAASAAWRRGESLVSLARGSAAQALHRAQKPLLLLQGHWDSLWQPDLVLGAISADAWLGGFARLAEEADLHAGGGGFGFGFGGWARTFDLQAAEAEEVPGVAFATLLSDEGDAAQWLGAVEVMSWSLTRFHGRKGRLLVPLLVLCQERCGLIHAGLQERGLVPVSAPELSIAALPEKRPVPSRDGWRRLHLWGLTVFRRIVYLDADTLVVGSLQHLLQLPSSVHFAAAGLGLDHQQIRFQRLNTGVMAIVPDRALFEAMRDTLEHGVLHAHPEFRLQGYLDQAWVDLFFRYISRQPRGGSLSGVSPAGRCPASGGAAAALGGLRWCWGGGPERLLAEPWGQLPGVLQRLEHLQRRGLRLLPAGPSRRFRRADQRAPLARGHLQALAAHRALEPICGGRVVVGCGRRSRGCTQKTCVQWVASGRKR